MRHPRKSIILSLERGGCPFWPPGKLIIIVLSGGPLSENAVFLHVSGKATPLLGGADDGERISEAKNLPLPLPNVAVRPWLDHTI